MNAKEFYKSYRADDSLSDLSYKVLDEILKINPAHVLEFGCGTGKHLDVFNRSGICTIGIDISLLNILTADVKYNLPCLIHSDETYLRNLANADCILTVSCLDHIEDISGIIQEFQRIANKGVLLAETNSFEGNFYYKHDYESYGFEKLDYKWKSDGDGGVYEIWRWQK